MAGSSANSQFRLRCDCTSLHVQQLGQHCHFWGYTEDRNSRECLLRSGTTGNSWGAQEVPGADGEELLPLLGARGTAILPGWGEHALWG